MEVSANDLEQKSHICVGASFTKGGGVTGAELCSVSIFFIFVHFGELLTE